MISFEVTINRAQGQNFKHIGDDLTAVISYGLLYVASFRSASQENHNILVPKQVLKISFTLKYMYVLSFREHVFVKKKKNVA